METLLRPVIYFVVSGTVCTIVCNLNEQGRPGIAGLVASFPVLFVLTSTLAYLNGGPQVAFEYARTMIISNVPWLAAVAVFAHIVHSGYNIVFAVISSLMMYTVIALAVKDLV